MAAQNAIIVSRARNASKKSDDSDEEDDDEETLQETLKRSQLEQTKFSNFWTGVKVGLESYDRKPAYEKKKILFHRIALQQRQESGLIINPNSSYKISWDLILAGFVLYSIIVIPYNIGLNVNPSNAANAVDWLITALFGVDIFLSLNTAYLDENTERLEFNRTKVMGHYAKFWLWVDIVATVPFDNIVQAFSSSQQGLSSIRIIRILRLVRLVKIYRILVQDERLENLTNNSGALSLVMLMVQIFYVAHLFACFWHFIALPQALGDFPQTWLTSFGYAGLPVIDRYIASLYYIIITMTTVGYGDIHPTNQLERIFGIGTMLTGGIVFGALVGRVTSLIDKRNPQAKAFKEKMDEFKAFLADCKLPQEIADRAKAAYTYFLTKRSAFGEAGIFDELPRSILKELIFQLYRDDISKINLFQNMDSAFIIEIVIHSRPFQAFADEDIFCEGDVCNEIIFLKTGLVRIIASTGDTEVVIGCVTMGNFFGDAEFFKNTTAIATYRTMSHCHLLNVPHTVMSRAMGLSARNGKQINRLMAARYASLISVLKTRGKKKERPTLGTKQRSQFLNGGNEGGGGANSRSFFGMIRQSSMMFRSNSMNMNDGQNQWQTHSLATMMSRNVWMDGEVQDSTKSMAFLDISGETAAKDTVRILLKNEEGLPYATERKISYLQEHYLLSPLGQKKIAWDFYVGLLIIYSVLVVPVEIAYNAPAFAFSNTFNLIINGFFFVDIVASFITAIHVSEFDALEVNHNVIAMEYLKGWFVIDVVSTVPFDTIVTAASSSSTNLSFTKLVKIIRLLRLLKLFRVLKLGAYVEKIEDTLGISPAFFHLLTLLVQVFFVAHWACCLWWGISSLLSTHPWYDNYGPHGFFALRLEGESVAARYLVSLYYTLTTMTTVGYGDIFPVNSNERIFVIILALCGASLFGYMIANVSSLLTSLGGANNTAKEHLVEVQEYLKEKNCPRGLEDKIRSHYKQQVKESSPYDVEHIAGRLPSMISNEILFNLYQKRISKIAFMPYIDNKSVVVYLLQKMTHLFCDEGYYLFKAGETCKEVSFFVSGEAFAFRSKPKLRAERMLTSIKDRLILVPKKKKSIGNEEDESLSNIITSAAAVVASAPSLRLPMTQHISGPADLWDVELEFPHWGEEEEQEAVGERGGVAHAARGDEDEDVKTNEEDTDSKGGEHKSDLDDKPSSFPLSSSNKKRVGFFRNLFVETGHGTSTNDLTASGGATSSREGSKDGSSIRSGRSQQHKTAAQYSLLQPQEKEKQSERSSDKGSDSKQSTSTSNWKASLTPGGSASSASRRINALAAKILKPKESLSFLLHSKDGVSEVDPVDEYIHRKKKTLRFLTASDFNSMDMTLIGKIEPGDFVGHTAFLAAEEERHDSSVRSVIPSTVYIFSKLEMSRLIRQEPSVAIQFQAAMTKAIVEQAAVVGKHNLRDERATFMRDLKRQYFRKRKVSSKMRTAESSKSGMFTTNNNNSNNNSSPASSMPNTPAASNASGKMMDWSNHSPRGGSVDGGDRSSMASSAEDLDSNSISPRAANAANSRKSRRRMSMRAATGLGEVNISDVRKVEKLFRRRNIYYDSDDSNDQEKRIKRNRLKQTPLLTRAANKITKRTRQLFQDSSSSEDDGITRNKRSYSLSEVDQLRMEIRGFERQIKIHIPPPQQQQIQQGRPSYSPLAASTPRGRVSNFKMVRRQSFPSLGNGDWKRSKVYDSLV